MLYSDSLRVHYNRSQLAEVICQLRFPAILTIGTNEPAQFQDAVRSLFPRFSVKQEQLPPKLVGAGTPNAHLESPAPVANYHFISADGKWKLNLTRGFISLSTVAYPGWEGFTQQFDLPLAEFIRLYQPAYFERIGLRYLNVFSRTALEMTDEPWRALISPAYLGPLAEEDVAEESILNCAVDTELSLDSTCRARIRAGQGKVKNNAPGAVQDDELKFLFDLDLAMSGQLDPRMAAAGLETLHAHATPIFQGAITDRLHTALQPR